MASKIGLRRGTIKLALKLAGMKLSRALQYGLAVQFKSKLELSLKEKLNRVVWFSSTLRFFEFQPNSWDVEGIRSDGLPWTIKTPLTSLQEAVHLLFTADPASVMRIRPSDKEDVMIVFNEVTKLIVTKLHFKSDGLVILEPRPGTLLDYVAELLLFVVLHLRCGGYDVKEVQTEFNGRILSAGRDTSVQEIVEQYNRIDEV